MLFKLDAVAKAFPRFALGPLSLQIQPGCVHGFAGPNGSGKTTTLKILMGLVRPDSGRLLIGDHTIDRRSGDWKHDLGYVPEEQHFYEGWTGARNLELHARLRRNWCMDRAEKLAKRLDLDLGQRARNLSRGNRVKLALVTALAYQPRLLVLDEPTSGLDPITRNEVLELLLEHASSDAGSVLFSTHIIPDMARIADMVTFIKEGHLIRSGAPADITESWRKVRFSFAFEKIELPGLVEHKVEGHMHLVVTSQIEAAKKILNELGALVRDINRISLDEAAVYILKGERGDHCSN